MSHIHNTIFNSIYRINIHRKIQHKNIRIQKHINEPNKRNSRQRNNRF